ncbi:MAG: hypothetical protein INR69_08720 [Mucilaginibacter polytrichastri]|nr:hypothetical protein [Mucilaginibacter polytrichastri]
MDSHIKDKYKISFENKILTFETGERINSKVVKINDSTIEEFLAGWFNADEIQEYLLPDIELAMKDSTSEIDNGMETISIVLFHDKVRFYPENKPQVTIPIYDFKEIVEGWRDFLSQPPLKLSPA